MKPNTIHKGDCLDLLKKMKPDSIDMAFADPPFNLGKNYSVWDDGQSYDAYLSWCRDWIAELIRVLKPGGSLLLHNIPKWLARFNCIIDELNLSSDKGSQMRFNNWIAWDAPSSPMGVSLQPSHYGILFFTKGEKGTIYELRMPHKRCRSTRCNQLLKDYGGKKHTIHPVGPLVSDVWTDIHRCKHSKYRNKAHPCQLPMPLLERLILLCTDAGDRVLDPFMGTGTTAVASKRLGRIFFGSELSEEYIAIAEQRLEAHIIESRVDGIWVGCHLNGILTVRDADIWDKSTGEFRPGWKNLFTNWPDTPEKRRLLNTQELIFRKDVADLIATLCKGNLLIPEEMEITNAG